MLLKLVGGGWKIYDVRDPGWTGVRKEHSRNGLREIGKFNIPTTGLSAT